MTATSHDQYQLGVESGRTAARQLRRLDGTGAAVMETLTENLAVAEGRAAFARGQVAGARAELDPDQDPVLKPSGHVDLDATYATGTPRSDRLVAALAADGKHPDDRRCFYCASDAEMASAIAGLPHPSIDMDSPPMLCPRWSDLHNTANQETTDV